MRILKSIILCPLLYALLLSSCSMLPPKHYPIAQEQSSKMPSPKPGQPGTRLDGAVSITGPTPPIQTAKLGPYTLEIYGQDDAVAPHMVFQKDGKTVKTVTVARDEELQILNTNLCKLTDAKDPNVVVVGALNCSNRNCYIFSLGKTVKLISTIYTAETPLLERQRNSEMMELSVSDPNLDCGAHGRPASVLIKWNQNKFVVDRQEMKKQNPYSSTCKGFNQAIAEEFKHLESDDHIPITFAPPEFAEQIISMYYCGDGFRAKQYFENHWPKSSPGKAEYWRSLMAELKISPYWPGSKGSE
jgi:hypothetical protein